VVQYADHGAVRPVLALIEAAQAVEMAEQLVGAVQEMNDHDKGYWLLAIGYWLLAIGYWLLAIGYWLLAIGYWLLAIGYWFLR
jgi:hypothetical protein